MTFQAATFWGHGHSRFGKKLPNILTLNSSPMEQRTLTSQCLFQKESLKSKRTMSKDSHQKSPGSPSPANQTLPNQLPSGQPVKPSCIQLMPTGLRATETSPSNSINGPMSSDGNSSIQLHSSEPENSSGKKAILPMLLSNKLKKKCT